MNFSAIETELREIDEDYSAGRMNAFGPSATHEEIFKETKKISELELQIFFRVTDQIHTASDDDTVVQRVLSETTNWEGTDARAAAPAPPTSPSEQQFTADDSTQQTSSETGGGATRPQPLQQPQSKDASEGLPPPTDTGSSSSSAKSFDDIAKLFRAKEASLRVIGDNLRQMSRHVATVNELVQRAHSASM